MGASARFVCCCSIISTDPVMTTMMKMVTMMSRHLRHIMNRVALLFLLCFSGPEHFVSQSFLLNSRDVGHAGDVAMDTC